MNMTALLSGLVQSSALVLGLWLVLRVVRRVAPDTRSWLWRLALLKLACSAIAVGTVTLYVLPGLRPTSPHTPELRQQPTPRTALPREAQRPLRIFELPAVAGAARAVVAPPRKAGVPTFDILVLAIWCGGIVFFGLRPVFDALKVRRWLRVAVPIDDPQIVSQLKDLSGRAGLRRVPRLLSSNFTPSPMVYGMWRPMVILPERMLCATAEDLRLALAHEIAHIRRRDLVWAITAWFVRAVLFFNPVAWIAEKELRAAQESATDQEAVWLTGATVNAYGEMLLRAMIPNRVAWNPSGLPMFDSFQNAQRRLNAMKYFSNSSSFTRKVLGLAPVAIGTVALPTYILAPNDDAHTPAPKPVHHTRQAATGNGELVLTTKISPYPSGPSAGREVPTRSSDHSSKKGVPSYLVMSIPPANVAEKVISASAGLLTSEPARAKHGGGTRLTMLTAAAIQSEDLKQGAQDAEKKLEERVAKLIATQDARITEYRRWADQREQEAEQREREAQQRKREGEQRDRAALLREQVIEQRESNGYRFDGPNQKKEDVRLRADDARQHDADQYQLQLDQKQRDTDQWQREFDARSIAAMNAETQHGIAAAKEDYQARIRELIAEEIGRRSAVVSPTFESSDAGMHVVKTSSGLSLAIPDGYLIAQAKPSDNGGYTVVLRRAKG